MQRECQKVSQLGQRRKKKDSKFACFTGGFRQRMVMSCDLYGYVHILLVMISSVIYCGLMNSAFYYLIPTDSKSNCTSQNKITWTNKTDLL